MASLANDPGGARRVLVMVDGKRKAIRLGKVPKKQAESVVRHVEALAASRIDGSAPAEQTSRWLAGVSPALRERLVRAGLAGPVRPTRSDSTRDLISQFSSQRFPRLKPRTIANYRTSFESFALFIGSAKSVAEISQGDAEAFRDSRLNRGLAEATVRRRCADACILMGYAVKHRIIDRNPFTEAGDAVPRKIRSTTRTAEVTRETFTAVLAMIDDPELRVAIALSRYGGLRVPSEVRQLRWSDVDWGRRTLRVTSPKTERHYGRGERITPMPPELCELVEVLFVFSSVAAQTKPWSCRRSPSARTTTSVEN